MAITPISYTLLFHLQGTRLISPSLSYSSTDDATQTTAATSSTIKSNFSVVYNPNYTDIDELYGGGKEKNVKNENNTENNKKRKRKDSEDEGIISFIRRNRIFAT